MKKQVQYNSSDEKLIAAFRELQTHAQQVYEMWDEKYAEVIPFFSKHKYEILKEMGDAEADYTDEYLSGLMQMRNALKSICSTITNKNNFSGINRIKPFKQI